jgi:hypothetical protein
MAILHVITGAGADDEPSLGRQARLDIAALGAALPSAHSKPRLPLRNIAQINRLVNQD